MKATTTCRPTMLSRYPSISLSRVSMSRSDNPVAGQLDSTQVAVIGGGPGGYAAAFMAADLGLRVALVDLEPNPGGLPYRGCIPSKALLHVAKVIGESRRAADWD